MLLFWTFVPGCGECCFSGLLVNACIVSLVFGWAQIALEFLSDCKSKFLMSLEVGRMDEAFEAAKALNDKVNSPLSIALNLPLCSVRAHIQGFQCFPFAVTCGLLWCS